MLPGGLLTPSLAAGARLVVLSGYTAGCPAAPVRVVLDQRGARVVLVLASYETVAWRLDVRPGTELVAVVLSAYSEVAVAGHGCAPVYRLALPCAATPGSAACQDLMRILQARLGRSQPDEFRAYTKLPEQVALASFRRERTDSTPRPASSISQVDGSGTNSCNSKPERRSSHACWISSLSLRI